MAGGSHMSAETCKVSRDVNDSAYLISMAIAIVTMQAGFALLEAGSIRSLNASNIMIKNMLDLCCGTIAWWLVGYGLAYGRSETSKPNGFFGNGDFGSEEIDFIFFFFQLSFAATASTIDSGAVAERMKIWVYMGLSTFMTAFTYPVVVHWVWDTSGWLYKMGFVDFAGAGVVHLLGGVSGLVCTWWLGPRLGCMGRKVPEDCVVDDEHVQLAQIVFEGEKVHVLYGSMILFFSWFAFNAGSTLAVTQNNDLVAGHVLFTTVMAASSSTMTGFFLSTYRYGAIEPDVVAASLLGGLVSITAGPHVVTGKVALVIGMFSALLVEGATKLTKRFKIDDPVGVIPVHLVNGAFGVMMVGLFANETHCGGSTRYQGLIYSGEVRLFLTQLLGVCVIVAWTVACTLGYFVLVEKVMGVKSRVEAIVEIVGLDLTEHNIDHFNKLSCIFKLQKKISENNEAVAQLDLLRSHNQSNSQIYNGGQAYKVIPITAAVAEQPLAKSPIGNKNRSLSNATMKFIASPSSRNLHLDSPPETSNG